MNVWQSLWICLFYRQIHVKTCSNNSGLPTGFSQVIIWSISGATLLSLSYQIQVHFLFISTCECKVNLFIDIQPFETMQLKKFFLIAQRCVAENVLERYSPDQSTLFFPVQIS